MPFNPFTALAAKIYGAIALAALAAFAWQTVRIEGLKVWPISITGLEQKLADRTAERDAERAAHQQTRSTYLAAQLEAARLERARLERVKAQQQEITDEVASDYRRRLDDAGARAERLRDELLRAGERAAGAGRAVGLPAAADPPGGADEASGYPRLPAEQLEHDIIATEQAIQLDALISWVERQAQVEVNGAADAP